MFFSTNRPRCSTCCKIPLSRVLLLYTAADIPAASNGTYFSDATAICVEQRPHPVKFVYLLRKISSDLLRIGFQGKRRRLRAMTLALSMTQWFTWSSIHWLGIYVEDTVSHAIKVIYISHLVHTTASHTDQKQLVVSLYAGSGAHREKMPSRYYLDPTILTSSSGYDTGYTGSSEVIIASPLLLFSLEWGSGPLRYIHPSCNTHHTHTVTLLNRLALYNLLKSTIYTRFSQVPTTSAGL